MHHDGVWAAFFLWLWKTMGSSGYGSKYRIFHEHSTIYPFILQFLRFPTGQHRVSFFVSKSVYTLVDSVGRCFDDSLPIS
jgi:hypothetical protein